MKQLYKKKLCFNVAYLLSVGYASDLSLRNADAPWYENKWFYDSNHDLLIQKLVCYPLHRSAPTWYCG